MRSATLPPISTKPFKDGNRGTNPWLRSLLVLGLLYLFLVGITALSSTLKSMGASEAEGMIQAIRNPFAALSVGILATVLVQSSSVTTSLIVAAAFQTAQTGVGLEDAIEPFIPMVMGANIGTTVTCTLAALGHVTRDVEFERAFGGATMHDFFNLITVAILLPVELATGFLRSSAVWLVQTLQLGDGMKFDSPVKSAVKEGYKAIEFLAKDVLGISGTFLHGTMIAVGIGLIFLCLVFITKNMRALMATRFERIMNRTLQKSGVVGMLIGMLITAAVQSSSITTSILIPMFGAGLLSHANGLPIMLGANMGTTITALLAAVATGPAGLAIAFVHLLFNLTGILILYPIERVRMIPIRLSEGLARATVASKWWLLLFMGGTFVGIPLLGIMFFG